MYTHHTLPSHVHGPTNGLSWNVGRGDHTSFILDYIFRDRILGWSLFDTEITSHWSSSITLDLNIQLLVPAVMIFIRIILLFVTILNHNILIHLFTLREIALFIELLRGEEQRCYYNRLLRTKFNEYFGLKSKISFKTFTSILTG